MKPLSQIQGERLARRSPGKAARELAVLDLVTRIDNGTRTSARERATGLLEGLTSAARCLRCGRALTDPDSRARGIGPDCLAEFGGSEAWDGYRDALIAAHAAGGTP